MFDVLSERGEVAHGLVHRVGIGAMVHEAIGRVGGFSATGYNSARAVSEVSVLAERAGGGL